MCGACLCVCFEYIAMCMYVYRCPWRSKEHWSLEVTVTGGWYTFYEGCRLISATLQEWYMILSLHLLQHYVYQDILLFPKFYSSGSLDASAFSSLSSTRDSIVFPSSVNTSSQTSCIFSQYSIAVKVLHSLRCQKEDSKFISNLTVYYRSKEHFYSALMSNSQVL